MRIIKSLIVREMIGLFCILIFQKIDNLLPWIARPKLFSKKASFGSEKNIVTE
jgi:hypothetical protein